MPQGVVAERTIPAWLTEQPLLTPPPPQITDAVEDSRDIRSTGGSRWQGVPGAYLTPHSPESGLPTGEEAFPAGRALFMAHLSEEDTVGLR